MRIPLPFEHARAVMRSTRIAGFARFTRALLAAAQLFTMHGAWAAGSGPSPAEATQPQSRLVTLASGITLNYVVQGDPAGPVIVLLHGVGDSWHSYERVLPRLSPRYRVYAVTLRGHGWSDHPANGFSRADFAGDIAGFLDALQLRHVVLVGHSLGSFVAEQVAADHADRIDKLVLVGAGPGTVPDPQLRRALITSFQQLHDPIDYTFARDFQASTIHAPVPPDFFEALVAEAMKAPAATWQGIAAAWEHDGDGDDGFLGRIQAPTLLLWGDHDEIFLRAQQDELLHRIGHARLIVYADTGHALHWERPERFATDLQHFIEAPGAAVGRQGTQRDSRTH